MDPDLNLKNAVEGIKTEDGRIGKLGENFEYLMNHTKEYEEGEIDFDDLPNFSEWTNNIIRLGVIIGGELQAEHTTFYEVSTENDILKITIDEEEAHEIHELNTNSRLRSISIETSIDYWSTIETVKEMHKETGKEIENITKHVSKPDVDLEGQREDIPIKSGIGELFFYAILFGQGWEQEVPSFKIIIDEERHEISRIVKKKDPDVAEGLVVKHAREFTEIPEYYNNIKHSKNSDSHS